MFVNNEECCCNPPVAVCPTNCNCDGTDVIIQATSETHVAKTTDCNATTQLQNVIGTVTDANGTWKFFRMPADGLNAQTATVCGGTFGAKKPGVTVYFDDGYDPCFTAGTETLNYLYAFSCVGDGTVALSLFTSLLGCGYDGLTYYAPFNLIVGLSFLEQAIATPSCSGSNLTATFTFSNLSGGQAPPSGSASISLNLSDQGFRTCQYFEVTGCGGLPAEGLSLTIFTVSSQTDTSGQAVITINGQGTQPFIANGAGRFVTISDTRTFVNGATTTLAMTVASGFSCFAGCAWPISNTLHATFSGAGSRDFAKSGTNWVSSFSFGGHAWVCTISEAGGFSVTRDGVGCTDESLTLNSCFIPGLTSFSLTLDPGSCGSELGLASLTE